MALEFHLWFHFLCKGRLNNWNWGPPPLFLVVGGFTHQMHLGQHRSVGEVPSSPRAAVPMAPNAPSATCPTSRRPWTSACATRTRFTGYVGLLLWMDEILHHFEAMANLCLLVVTGKSSFQGSLGGAGFCPSAVWK